ncbi:MAG: hypothetical protein WDA59_01440 [Methanofastidiosum sp.]|jgi:tetrahydromethanopterin S-methyltransferase subunit G|nr:hypothetical protein [Candidatus Cloacimonadota bacterium]
MAKIDEVLIAIAEIKKDTSEIFRRLDKINGSIADYQVVKKRVDDLEKKTDKTNDCVKEISSLLNGIKIKIWSVAGLIGAIMGFIGVVVGKFI